MKHTTRDCLIVFSLFGLLTAFLILVNVLM